MTLDQVTYVVLEETDPERPPAVKTQEVRGQGWYVRVRVSLADLVRVEARVEEGGVCWAVVPCEQLERIRTETIVLRKSKFMARI